MFLFDYALVRRVQSYMGQLHSGTGIPMECMVLVEMEADQSLVVHGSYRAAYRYYDQLIVTDRDTYFSDILAGTVRTSEGTLSVESEQANAARIIFDFLNAVRSHHPPLASGPSVLPAMRVLQAVQDEWDARYGAQSIPGRLPNGFSGST
jgi:2-hydroxy-4-carboxymuconate semialdehyde hemiacetal dehydrogenase